MESYFIGSHSPLKEAHPSGVVLGEGRGYGLFPTLEQEVECLREGEQHHRVNDGERQHISGDHAVDHRHERTRQSYSTVHKIVKLGQNR